MFNSPYYIGILFKEDFLKHFQNFIFFINELDISQSNNTKSLLQEHYQKEFRITPHYQTKKIAGEDHSPTFESTVSYSEELHFSAIGTSKKLAESKVAYDICVHFQLLPKPKKLKYQNIKALWMELKDQQSRKSYINPNLNKFFGFSDQFDSIQAFNPSRLKRISKCSISHKKYATLGAFYIQFLANVSVLEANLLDETITRPNVVGIGVVSNNALMKLYNSNIINIKSLPYQSNNDYEQSYLIDCIQSLFGISFLQTLYNQHENSYIEILESSESIKWINRRVKNLSIDCNINKDFIPSFTLEYLQKYGFYLSLKRNAFEEYFLKIKHIRTCKEFILTSNKQAINKKQSMIELASICLKTLDRMTGVYLIPSYSIAQTQKDLISFFIRNINDDVEFNISHEELKFLDNLYHEYNSHDIEQLKEEWHSNHLNTLHKAIILYLIHKSLNLINTDIQYDQYPALISLLNKEIFFYENSNVQSFDDKSYEIDLNKPCESNLSDEKTLASTSNNCHNLDVILEQYNRLSLEELESLWKYKNQSFKFVEEAATVLAKIRYERGIDFKLYGYNSFLNIDLITELNLPHYKHKNIKNNIHNNFIIDHQDNRERKLKEIVVRKGQNNFRNTLFKYWRKCSITGCEIKEIIDAAHIYPYRSEKDNNIKNGLLLRTDLHRLFDNYLLSINPESLTVHISEKIKDSHYSSLNGIKIEDKIGLSKTALNHHWFLFTSMD